MRAKPGGRGTSRIGVTWSRFATPSSSFRLEPVPRDRVKAVVRMSIHSSSPQNTYAVEWQPCSASRPNSGEMQERYGADASLRPASLTLSNSAGHFVTTLTKRGASPPPSNLAGKQHAVPTISQFGVRQHISGGRRCHCEDQ